MSLRIAPVFQLAIAIGLCWLIQKLFPSFNFVFYGQAVLFVIPPLIGLIILILSINQFRIARTTVNPLHPERANKLVTDGIFHLTRNPMYLSMVLLLLGVVIWTGNLIGLFVIVGFIVSMTRLQIQPEERILTETFGDKYLQYMKVTRRWI